MSTKYSSFRERSEWINPTEPYTLYYRGPVRRKDKMEVVTLEDDLKNILVVAPEVRKKR